VLCYIENFAVTDVIKQNFNELITNSKIREFYTQKSRILNPGKVVTHECLGHPHGPGGK